LVKDDQPVESFAFAIWGNWDLQMMLSSQCKREKIPLPSYFHKWVDLRDLFERTYQPDGVRTVNRAGLQGIVTI
jgi:inhibitor of KinA sporulation pathway (predicted exonuclease)